MAGRHSDQPSPDCLLGLGQSLESSSPSTRTTPRVDNDASDISAPTLLPQSRRGRRAQLPRPAILPLDMDKALRGATAKWHFPDTAHTDNRVFQMHERRISDRDGAG